MKKQRQQGFTLIELMIVIAIIGILAAVALPAYQDYTVKAKVAGVSSLAAPFFTASALFCNNVDGTAYTNTGLGLGTKTDYSSEYVKSIEAAAGTAPVSVVITATMNAIGSGVGDDQTIIWNGTCSATKLTWAVDAATSTVDDKYLPKA